LGAGETTAQGAARELFEETGLRLLPGGLGEAVWQEVTEFPFDGRRYRQEQEFFLVRIGTWQVDTAGFEEVERNSVDDHRWWTVDELAATEDRYYPQNLPDLLRSLLEG
jgi:8-oxo-dGTP pyrophosphatase MutT (NUDIX family)